MLSTGKKQKGFEDCATQKAYSGNDLINEKSLNNGDIRDNTGFCKPAIVFLFLSKNLLQY